MFVTRKKYDDLLERVERLEDSRRKMGADTLDYGSVPYKGAKPQMMLSTIFSGKKVIPSKSVSTKEVLDAVIGYLGLKLEITVPQEEGMQVVASEQEGEAEETLLRGASFSVSEQAPETAQAESFEALGWGPAENQGKPSWKEAPDWADYLDQDDFGKWGFFESHPSLYSNARFAGRMLVVSCGPLQEGDTLEERPEGKPVEMYAGPNRTALYNLKQPDGEYAFQRKDGDGNSQYATAQVKNGEALIPETAWRNAIEL